MASREATVTAILLPTCSCNLDSCICRQAKDVMVKQHNKAAAAAAAAAIEPCLSKAKQTEQSCSSSSSRQRRREADHPGECAEGPNSFEISHAEVGQVGGDPALQDEESKANDAVHPAQRHHLHCVVCCACRRCLAYPCNHIAGALTNASTRSISFTTRV